MTPWPPEKGKPFLARRIVLIRNPSDRPVKKENLITIRDAIVLNDTQVARVVTKDRYWIVPLGRLWEIEYAGGSEAHGNVLKIIDQMGDAQTKLLLQNPTTSPPQTQSYA